MTILHTHPEHTPHSRMDALQNIHRTCFLSIQASKSDIRSLFPKPNLIDMRY